jgi:hypothetical protein
VSGDGGVYQINLLAAASVAEMGKRRGTREGRRSHAFPTREHINKRGYKFVNSSSDKR